MTEMIKKALADADVSLWSVTEELTDEAQLYFIRRSPDMRRINRTKKYEVTVYRDSVKDGKPMRGASSVNIVPSQPYGEILEAVKSAYYAASFAANPGYEMPAAVQAEPCVIDSDLSCRSVEESAMLMAQALYSADNADTAYINSAEFFSRAKTVHLITSYGTDVCYTKYSVDGEFVVQCKEPVDVEMFHTFAYDSPDTAAISEKAAQALVSVTDRAKAKPELPDGTYSLILTDDHVSEILYYYAARSSASMIYPRYSGWTVGTDVQGDEVQGEKLNIKLHATYPYSGEGIVMRDRQLVKDGKMMLIHGNARLCSYLGTEPTGSYDSLICDNGTAEPDDMKKEPYLHVVSFSDFQVDVMDGHFGGEIRLAYYFDGTETKVVTGGSVNGSMADCRANMVFSTRRYDSASYHGPYAVKLPNVKVAGTL